MLAKLRLRTKLFLLLAFVLAGTVLAGAYGMFALHESRLAADRSLRDSEQILRAVRAAGTAHVAFKAQIHEFKNLLLRGHDEEQFDWYLANFRKATDAIRREFDAVAAAMVTLGMSSASVAEARQMHDAIVREHLTALQGFQRGSAESALTTDRAVRGKDRVLDDKIGGIVSDLQAFSADAATRLHQEAEARSRRAMLALLACVLLLSLVGIVAGGFVVRQLRAELGGEPAYAKEVAERIAEGDLRSVVEVSRRDSASLLHAMHRMTGNLRRLVGAVSQAAHSVAHTSGQIAQGNLNLSQRTEEQASTLEQTAAQMEELTATVTRNAEQAREGSRLALQASELARRGGSAVEEVVGTMKSLSASSERISEITGVIESIAFQTNILALNAAVESARAGEHGRGFAVVATEVRALAERSAHAAKEIKALLASSVQQVRDGARLADGAGGAVQDMVAAIARVSELIADIAAASGEQSAGIEQVNTAVTQMDQAVQQNASLVEEASAATESLEEQARALLGLIEAFRLPNDLRPEALGSESAGLPLVPALPASAIG